MFSGNRVTVSARFATFYEGIYLTAEACPGRTTCVRFDSVFEKSSPKSALDGFHRAIGLSRSERRRETKGAIIDKAADVTFVGRFEGPGDTCHLGMFDSVLTVETVLAAKPAPLPK